MWTVTITVARAGLPTLTVEGDRPARPYRYFVVFEHGMMILHQPDPATDANWPPLFEVTPVSHPVAEPTDAVFVLTDTGQRVTMRCDTGAASLFAQGFQVAVDVPVYGPVTAWMARRTPTRQTVQLSASFRTRRAQSVEQWWRKLKGVWTP